MKNENSCSCNSSKNKTVFACSGAADLGMASDLLARKIHLLGERQMKCLAFVSAGITEMIDSVKDSEMLVIDGCALDCGKKTFEKNGLNQFIHLRLTDLGFEKGKTPATPQVVDQMYEKAILLM